ncbi:MAG TPA: hypothetical protein VJ782_08700 [Aeromicrobium sp.]|nr:hypothetical protein [Aeromicrobium sp.]
MDTRTSDGPGASVHTPRPDGPVTGDPVDAVMISGVGPENLTRLSDAPSTYQLAAMSGIVCRGAAPAVHAFGDPVPDDSLADLLDATGEWIGVFHSPAMDEFVIGSDYVGFGQAFYSIVDTPQSGRTVLVGSNFRSVLGLLRDMGITPDLDFAQLLPSIIARDNMFRTRWSSRTFATQVRVLESDEILVASTQGCGVVTRPTLPSSADYRTLLERGFSKAVDTVVGAARSDLPLVIGLSGGKDSRALLGFAIAGGVEKDIFINTRSPDGAGAYRDTLSKDLEVSCRLVEGYGLRWWNQGSSVLSILSLDEDLSGWQNYQSNGSFEFISRYVVAESVPRGYMTGIGGELMRSFWGPVYMNAQKRWWAAAKGDAAHLTTDAESLFDKICPSFEIDPDLHAASRAAFVESLSFPGANGIFEQLDRAYLENRNRCHSGVGRRQLQFGSRYAFPMVQPDFFAADRLLDPAESADGRLLFDVIAMAAPELHQLEYVSPPWPESFARPTGPSRWDGIDGAGAARARDAAAQAVEAAAKARAAMDPSRPAFQRYAFSEPALERVSQNMELVLDAVGLDEQASQGVLRRVARYSQLDEKGLRVILAASETAADVLLPQSVPMRLLRADVGARSRVAMELRSDHESGDAHRPGGELRLPAVIESLDLSGVSCDLSVTRRRFRPTRVSVRLSNTRAGAEAACYVYVKGTRVANEKYKEDPDFQFELEPAAEGTVRAEVFLRWIGDPGVQRLIRIEEASPDRSGGVRRRLAGVFRRLRKTTV